tara:strand:+ start:381 stop:1301 length:921 start_codon:yes stop_codon:yes gene_type:complete
MSTGNMQRKTWVEPLLTNEEDIAHFKVDDVAQIPKILCHCAELGAETIVVNGGDGTADLVFSSLLNHNPYKHLPTLALLPSGKANMTSAGWGLTGDPEDALRAVLKYRRLGSLSPYAVERSLVCVHRNDARPPLYGAFFGAAEVIDGIQLCRRYIYPLKIPNSLSHITTLAILLWRNFFGQLGDSSIKITDDNGLIENGRFFAIVVTTLDKLLLGLKLKPEKIESLPGPLTYLSLRAGASVSLRAASSLITRHIGPGVGRMVRSSKRLTIKLSGAYTLDGELYEAQSGEELILDGSKKLRFLQFPK